MLNKIDENTLQDVAHIGGHNITFTIDVSSRGMARYHAAMKLLIDHMIEQQENKKRAEGS